MIWLFIRLSGEAGRLHLQVPTSTHFYFKQVFGMFGYVEDLAFLRRMVAFCAQMRPRSRAETLRIRCSIEHYRRYMFFTLPGQSKQCTNSDKKRGFPKVSQNTNSEFI